MKPGKTDAPRENVLSPLTMELLDEIGKNVRKKGNIFQSFYSEHAGKPFNSAKALRNWLERKIKKVKLPEGNSIDVNRWQCHNLRGSKLTDLHQNKKLTFSELKVISGHVRDDNLSLYIKVDRQNVQQKLL